MPVDDVSEILEAANKWRGEIINHTINLERVIDEYIGQYFCDDYEKSIELLNQIVTSNLNFSRKIKIFQFVVSKRNDGLNGEFPRMFKELDNIRKIRNFLAHTYIDATILAMDNYSNKKFSFMNQLVDFFKSERIIKTEAELNKMSALIKRYHDRIIARLS